MRISVVVENVGWGIFADRERQAVGVHRAAEQILPRIDRFALSAKTDRLADEIALKTHIGSRMTRFIGLGAGETGDAEGALQPVALVDLGIEIGFAAIPQAQPKKGGVRDGCLRASTFSTCS